jgi:hypothetical protein
MTHASLRRLSRLANRDGGWCGSSSAGHGRQNSSVRGFCYVVLWFAVARQTPVPPVRKHSEVDCCLACRKRECAN